MKKTRVSLFLFLIVFILPTMTFTGNTVLFVNETRGASDEKLSELRSKAEQGDVDSQFNLGYMYEKGKGVPKDFKEAAKWYRKAAEQGHAKGQTDLGYMYLCGYGVPQDYTEAASWYRKAAEQGDSFAQGILGGLYFSGHGVPQNYTEGVSWYRKAAEQGNALVAMKSLGACYEHGRGVPQNYKTAYIWYSLAAAKVSGKFRKDVVDARDRVAKRLSPAALEQAQDIAREWRPKK